MSKSLCTYVYVDGFNLYYRAVRNTPHKWLNLIRLCRQTLNPENKIERLRYFTADVSGRRDIEAPHRQQVYLRALKARRKRKPLRLSDLRKPLRDKPLETDVLKGLFERDLDVKPLEQRIVATIIGVPEANVPKT